jgi:hypothetical protein
MNDLIAGVMPEFSRVEELIAAKLRSDGFSVIRGESQEWAARYSLDRGNLDGNIAIFFNPVEGPGEGERSLAYRIVWESITEGSVRVSREAIPDEIALVFTSRLEKVLHRELQPRGERNPNVGVGLLPVAAAARLDALR